MKFQRRQLVAAMAGLMLGLSAGAASAMGGPSGAAVGMPAQGHIGEVIVNPYKIAPLTAIVRTGGYVVKNASVRVVPKKGAARSPIKFPIVRFARMPASRLPVCMRTTSIRWK